LKSYIKLIGPSIDKGLDAMDGLLKNLNKRFLYGETVSHIVGVVDPTFDLKTGSLVRKGRETLGDDDYVIEWEQPPTSQQVRGLIRLIDESLVFTGCRYTITTK
jgi:hypothetical protein